VGFFRVVRFGDAKDDEKVAGAHTLHVLPYMLSDGANEVETYLFYV
jgi:hypothetical protein